MAQSFEYKVVELREGIVGGKMSGDKLEKTLNEHGRQGWQLKAVTAVEIKGRIEPGGVEGVLVTFEAAEGVAADPALGGEPGLSGLYDGNEPRVGADDRRRTSSSHHHHLLRQRRRGAGT